MTATERVAAIFAVVSTLMLVGCAQTQGFVESADEPADFDGTPAAAPLPGEAIHHESDSTQPESNPDLAITPDAPHCQSFPDRPATWGVMGFRGYAFDNRMAPNGLEYKALFTLDFDFNVWLWQSQGLYLFGDSAFWGQRAAPGVTNSSQGAFDFSKREFDFTSGLAWNYAGLLEARAFAYSFNNLNRGYSSAAPSGFADGVGLENRLYLGAEYAKLRTADFDVARANFVSVGFYPTKDMVDADGNDFRPGPFVRAYVTLDAPIPRTYVYADAQLICTHSFAAEMLTLDAGVAARPWANVQRLELRLGSGNSFDPHSAEWETGLYGQVRYIY